MAESLAERLERIKAAQAVEAEARKAAKEEKAQAKKEEAQVQKAAQEDQAEILAWLRSVAAATAPAPASELDPDANALHPNMGGLFLGKAGYGKTFTTKREILDALLASTNTNEETEDNTPAPGTPSTASCADGGDARLETPAREPEAAPATSQEDVRKSRTRRLIQVGALTDRYLETAGVEPEEVAALLLQLVQLPEVMATIRSHKMARAGERLAGLSNEKRRDHPCPRDYKKNPER